MIQEKTQQAFDAIASAIEEHDPIKVYVLVSGGNDSTVAASVAALSGARLDGIVHINTGIGVEQTREYVREFNGYRSQ